MKKCIILCSVLALLAGISYTHAQGLLQYVQPLSGTAPSTTLAALKHSEAGSEKNANTIPAVGLPFGMTQFTPQTRLTENKCIPPYFYKDSLFTGFRGSHWLSGSCTQDYGSFTIMPVTGALQTTVNNYAQVFSHQQELATPVYYQLTLPAAHLVTAVTATARCGMMQFTLQQDDSLYILVTPNSDQAKGFIQVDAARGEVWGYNPVHRIYQGWGKPAGFNGWFFIKIDKAIAGSGTYAGDQRFTAVSIQEQKGMGAFIGFAMKKGEKLRLRIGTSFSSLEGARKNLQAEIPGWDFEQVVAQSKQQWEKSLSRIQVETGNEKDKRIFYTALYHAYQHPRLFSDVDGTYPAFAGSGGLKKVAGQYYDDFSMWDIYRAQLPLLEVIQPAMINELVRSLVLKGQEGGWLPIFPCWNSYTAAMIGDHSTAVISGAYAKGFRGYDVQAAYRLMRKNAFETANPTDYKNGMGRRALPSYLQYGYIPMEDSVPEAFHKKEQVSRTLEYAFDDYALSVVAKGLNKANDYVILQKRALNYRNVFDTSVGMVRGRYANGQWVMPFNPDKRESYITEGTPRQYTFYVPQDVPGLAKLMGGTSKLEASLDSLFAKDEYWHGNEPGHQIPFMYNYTASPWKTQRMVRQILREEYNDGPGGLSGNDDAGQMSAWYIWAAMGLYPLNPVPGEYMLSSPLFDKVTIQLPGNKKLQIICHKKDDPAIYIHKVMLNGKSYTKNFLTYPLIRQGGKLEIWLQQEPAKGGAAAHHSNGR